MTVAHWRASEAWRGMAGKRWGSDLCGMKGNEIAGEVFPASRASGRKDK